MVFCFCKKHIPQRKMKLYRLMILMVRYIIPTVNLIHAVFLLFFFGSIIYTVMKKAFDKRGRILIIEALIEDAEFVLINLHNANTENDQLTTFFGTDTFVRKFRSY